MFIGGDGQGTLVVGGRAKCGGLLDYHSFGAASDAHLLLLRDEVADVGGRRRCHHHVPGTVPHRRRVRAHAGGYTLSGSPGATENVKCSRRHARSSGLGPIEGKDRCLRVPAISMRPFYPPNHGSILSVKCSLLLVYAHPVCKFLRLKIQPPEDLTAVDFWVLEHGPSLFSSETRLELPDRPRFGHNTRERPTWTSSHPLASPGHTPGDRTEGPQDPRTRTKLLRAPRYLEI